MISVSKGVTLSFHVSSRQSRRCLSRASNVDKNLQAKVFSFALDIRHDVDLETLMRCTGVPQTFRAFQKNHQHK